MFTDVYNVGGTKEHSYRMYGSQSELPSLI